MKKKELENARSEEGEGEEGEGVKVVTKELVFEEPENREKLDAFSSG